VIYVPVSEQAAAVQRLSWFQSLPFKWVNLCRYIWLDALANSTAGNKPKVGLYTLLNPVGPIARKRLVSTLEPIKRYPGFKACFQIQLVPLH
jgi:hypothetical protein